LDVRDEGPGISPSDLPKVFDRFYRAQTARSQPGSGLGLAIVQQVVTSHGGSVTASSPREGGTAIHIELPVVAEQEMDPDPEHRLAEVNWPAAPDAPPDGGNPTPNRSAFDLPLRP
jgi:signal transduction histidine kinase